VKTQKPDKDFYTIQGKLVPRVTTILQAIPKPALVYWYEKQGRLKMQSLILDLIARRVKVTPEKIEEFSKVKAAEEAKARAAQTGQDLHTAIQEYLQHDTMPEKRSPIVPAFKLWLKWWQSRKLQALDIEKTVYDLENKYAGTLDCRAKFEKKPVVLDWKSSNAIYPEYFLQSVAYENAAAKLKMPTTAGYIVRIPKDGEGEVEVARRPDDITINDFLLVKQFWLFWRRLTGKPVGD